MKIQQIKYYFALGLAAAMMAACDVEDPSLEYIPFSPSQIAPSSQATQQQREVISSLIDNMVKVEAGQFWMGVQSRSSQRANYFPGYTALSDSMKLTMAVDADGNITYTKNNFYVDFVHLTDKTTYRHTLSNGKVRTDTIYYTQIHRMPSTTGRDNGNLWVGPVTAMSMPEDYYIGRYEVSQSEWTAVMGEGNWPTGRRCIEASADDLRNSPWYDAVGKGPDYPAYNVWYADALAFCDRLNQLCGLPDASGYQFRLPTEAEWECAARGGRYSRGYRYPGSDAYADVAWCSSNAFAPGLGAPKFGMHRHGELLPNELGLYDMAGNVSEWVLNTYYRYTYRDSIATAAFNAARLPRHADNGYEGDTLVLRGGSWYQGSATSFSSGSRQEYTPGANDVDRLQSAIMHCGFRVVLAK